MNTSSFYIYNASAGSGKTYSLVKNYLKVLLQSGKREPFKNILAITFTNKAVAEMKERIIGALKDFSSPKITENENVMFIELCKELNMQPKVLHLKSKELLYSLLKNYAAFDVSTIDKFTQKLIRTFAFDLKLPLNFEVELDTDFMLNKAVDNLISRAGSNKQLTKLLVEFAIEKTDDDKSWDLAYDFNKISKLLVNENDIPYLETLKDKTLEDFDVLKTHLRNELKATESQIVKVASNTLNFISECGLDHSDFSRSTLPNHFIKASNLDLYRLYDNKLEENLAERKSIYNKTLDGTLAQTIEAILPELEVNYLNLKQLVYHHKFLSNFYKNITPLSVLNLINQELNLIKEEQNTILISEFNTIVSNEVKNQPAPFIYERIGEKFKHYFIDEFQDTSQMQWSNLIPLIGNALSGENASAMLVGDAKQAIYRWRGGKAEQFIDLFNQNKNPFNINIELKSLDNNYRSTEAIIDFNNSFFEHLSSVVFSQKEHKDLYLNSKQNVISKNKGLVNISFLNITDDEGRDNIYPEHVLAQIKQCVNLGYSYSDICILVRKTKEGIAIANYLSDNHIDIVSSETLAIERSSEVNFIVALLHYLLNPSNQEFKIKVLSFLADKLNISNKHEFYTKHINLEIDAFYKSIYDYGINFNTNEVLQLPVYELVETIIYKFDLVEGSNAYIQFFLDFVFNFSNKHSSSISDFLAHYEQKKDKLKITSSDDNQAVKIMTIHKSKGLEFPIVIFPYADLDIYREIEPKVWFSLDEKAFCGFSEALLSYNKDIAEFGNQGLGIYNAHQAELELDNMNLLYVALTRAVNQLYIISSVNFDPKGILKVNEKLYSGLFINYLQNISEWDNHKLSYSFGEIEKANIELVSKEVNSAHNRFISIPKKEHNINILTKAGLLWDTSQKEALEKGNLIHEIMAQIKTNNDIDIALTSFLISGVINNEQHTYLKEIVNSIVFHPKLESYFSKDYTIYNERDIITENSIILRPDRLLINNKEEVVILDYKTGKPDNKHKQQLQIYQNALEAMNFSVIKKILIYIDEQLLIKEV
ncbi:MAG: UvrD-helicase domain-containing protein [Flavobacteriaceae bacterium]|nr:UvrD-helicase domain-containing protein [Flavobacteriaceae bacterium]